MGRRAPQVANECSPGSKSEYLTEFHTEHTDLLQEVQAAQIQRINQQKESTHYTVTKEDAAGGLGLIAKALTGKLDWGQQVKYTLKNGDCINTTLSEANRLHPGQIVQYDGEVIYVSDPEVFEVTTRPSESSQYQYHYESPGYSYPQGYVPENYNYGALRSQAQHYLQQRITQFNQQVAASRKPQTEEQNTKLDAIRGNLTNWMEQAANLTSEIDFQNIQTEVEAALGSFATTASTTANATVNYVTETSPFAPTPTHNAVMDDQASDVETTEEEPVKPEIEFIEKDYEKANLWGDDPLELATINSDTAGIKIGTVRGRGVYFKRQGDFELDKFSVTSSNGVIRMEVDEWVNDTAIVAKVDFDSDTLSVENLSNDSWVSNYHLVVEKQQGVLYVVLKKGKGKQKSKIEVTEKVTVPDSTDSMPTSEEIAQVKNDFDRKYVTIQPQI